MALACGEENMRANVSCKKHKWEIIEWCAKHRCECPGDTCNMNKDEHYMCASREERQRCTICRVVREVQASPYKTFNTQAAAKPNGLRKNIKKRKSQ